jgi:hypothetical protein
MRLPLRPVACTSDPDGQFVLHDVPGGLCQLTVDAKGYVRHRQVLRVAPGVAQSQEVELVHPPRFTFRLVDPLGAPAASRPWRVEAVCPQAVAEGRWGSETYSSEQGRTSEGGAAALSVGFAGPWRLLALVPEVGWARLEVVAEEGAATDLGELRLRPFVSVSGTVVRADTGAPVPSLLLDVRAEPDQPPFGLRWLRASGHADEGISGVEGRFRLRLPEGRFSLHPDGRLWLSETRAEVEVRETAPLGEVTVRVLPPARLRIAVRSAAGHPLAGEPYVLASGLRADAPVLLSVFASVKADAGGTATVEVRGAGASRWWVFVPGQGHGMLERIALRAGEEAWGKLALGRAAVANDFELDTGTVGASEGIRAELDDATFATGGRSLRVTVPREASKWLLHVTPGPLLAETGWGLSFDYRIPPGTRVGVLGRPGPLYGPIGNLVFGMSPLPLAGSTNQLTEDDQWRHAEVDLAPCRLLPDELRGEFPDEGCEVAFGPQEADAPGTEAGGERRFWLDNVRIGPPAG